jgi:hypothetical protein
MKTESEFPDVFLDFIRQHGIPFALRRDNAKSEMSQLAWKIPAMSRFNMSPRNGHLKVAKWILAYLKIFPKGEIIVDKKSKPFYYLIEYHPKWNNVYPDVEEEILNDLPRQCNQRSGWLSMLMQTMSMTKYKNRLIIVIVLILNNTSIRGYQSVRLL